MRKASRLLFILLIGLTACNHDPNAYITIYCGAEDISIRDGHHWFESNGPLLDNAEWRTKEEARNGKYSIKLNKEQPYGMTFRLYDVGPDSHWELSVWKKGEGGAIVVSAETHPYFYKAEYQTIEKDKNGWEKIQLSLSLPPTVYQKEVRMFLYHGEENDVYFDDLTIKHLKQPVYPKYPYTEYLQLHIDSTAMAKLKEKRKQAFKTGMLESSDSDYVDGSLVYGDDSLQIEIRLKGDWTDHLEGVKWSYRVKVKDGAFMGMESFSLQNPKTRDYLSEWVYHQWLIKEGVLTTKYLFLPMELNGQNVGMYAIEEHFEDHLLEHQDRRTAPILKFEEEGYWRLQQHQLFTKQNLSKHTADFEAAEIKPFNKNKTWKDEELKEQYDYAASLLDAFRYGSAAASEVWDIEALAKFYAITDVCKAYHSLRWHNMRFYFNPILGKLEPVAFDGYSEKGVYQWFNKAYLGQQVEQYNTLYFREDYCVFHPFNDAAFREKYYHYLDEYSSEDYVNGLIGSLKSELDKHNHMLHMEVSTYSYNYDFLKQRAAELREVVVSSDLGFCFKVYMEAAYDCVEARPFEGVSVVASWRNREEGKTELDVYNYHCKPISVVGVEGDSGQYLLPVPIKLPRYIDSLAALHTYLKPNTQLAFGRLLFTVEGNSTVYSYDIVKWAKPKPLSSYPKAETYNWQPLLQDGNRIVFKAGQEYNISIDVVIPAGYKVTLGSGCSLSFSNGAGFLSYSPVLALGKINDTIVIRATDDVSGSLAILQADSSQFAFVKFENLSDEAIGSAGEYGNWLRGSVNIYGGYSLFLNCVFSQANAEDALNLINANYGIQGSTFLHCQSDCIDADFAHGTIDYTKVSGAGNDGIDISGGSCFINDCMIAACKDKGVSLGESTISSTLSSSINDCSIALACKDESEITIASNGNIGDELVISGCPVGLTAYQKKNYFGPATIHVEAFDYQDVEQPFVIMPPSAIVYFDQAIKAKEITDLDQLLP